MATALLTTKLHIPRVRPDWVPRPRLVGRLNDGLHHKLTLISAPAGFGKTALLSEWARQSAFPVAWVSLDSADNDPARFWAYVIAAVQTRHPEMGEAALVALQSPQPPSIEPLVTGLINEIAQVPDALALVLDDLHVLTDHSTHEGITFLLDNLPSQMHLILSGRADPPWPLARLRARGDMAELRTRDLRFTPEEAACFLNGAMKLGLSAEDVAALEERTEGWVVGLQMAALSMRGRKDVSGFVRAFSGSHRFVLDYLVEEVLGQQPRDVQEFLLKTSILERMTGPLCDAVMGTWEGGELEDVGTRRLTQNQPTRPPLHRLSQSQAILEYLEAANLFIIPLDDERRWYRYHHLFADLLRSRLEQAQADQVPALHRRAGQWYESQGQIVEAVGHALLAAEVEWIEHLVAGNALVMIYHGELATVARWLDALPGEVKRARPWLCVAHAWVLAYAGQSGGVEPLLQDAEKALAGPTEQAGAPGLSISQGQRVAGHIAAIRAYVAALRGHEARAAELARDALQRLSEADLAVRGWTALVLGCVLRSQGDSAAAAQAFAGAISASRAAGNSHLAVDALWELAVFQLGRGQLRLVMTTCEEALQIASQYSGRGSQRLPVTGYTYSLMSCVLFEWNDLEGALRYAREGVDLCQRWGQADALVQGCFYLARALHIVGDIGGALDAIREAKQVAQGLGPWYGVTAGAHEARIRLAQGDLAAAARWMAESGLSADDELSVDYGISYGTLARILMAQGRLDQALALLKRWLKVAQAAGMMRSVIGALVLQALALQALGEGDQALAALELAVSLAEPEGYVRTFINEGPAMGALLRRAAVRGIRLEYVRKLLAALDSETADERYRLALSSLVEPLSERELEVLRLLATHLSGTQIAKELVISVSTVRSHIKNIYGKLDVHSRAEAVRRAGELGLL